MNTAVRIKTAHVTAANIDADSAALLQNFTAPSEAGMTKAAWNCNVMVADYASVRTPPSGLTRGQGYFGLELFFKVFTFSMNTTWRNSFFASTSTRKYGLVTVKIYDEYDVARYFQGVMQKGSFQAGNQNAIGYTDVRWAVSHGVEIS